MYLRLLFPRCLVFLFLVACDNPPWAKLSLIEAAEQGDLARVKAIISAGTNINQRRDGGQTALLAATINKQIDIVSYLLEKGADPDLADVTGQSPIFWAAENKHPEMVRTLIEHGADVNAKTGAGEVALTRAVVHHNVTIVQLLMDAGADPAIKSNWGYTPLSMATEGNYEEMLRIFNLAKNPTP